MGESIKNSKEVEDNSMKKTTIGIAIAAFVLVCTAESLFALNMALKEKEERESAAAEHAAGDNDG